MRKLSGTKALWCCVLCLAGCSTVESTPEQTALLYYQHVANTHEIRFSNPVTVPQRYFPIDFVTPIDRHGFWAIFVVCSLDTRASVLPGFRYDVRQFRVDYGQQLLGPLQPYTLRFEGAAELNTPADTAILRDAIAAEIHEGPTMAVFDRGVFPNLNYRFAIYVPRALPDYAGEQLSLRYTGQPAILRGNRHPPSDIPVVGGNAAGIAARCLP
jgi:hypothetical protein